MTRPSRRTGRECSALVALPAEIFQIHQQGSSIVRYVRLSSGGTAKSCQSLSQPIPADTSQEDLGALFDLQYLRAKDRPKNVRRAADPVRIVDLFSSCGLMSLGVAEACRALGRKFEPALALEVNERALEIYKANFSPIKSVCGDITAHINGTLGAATTAEEDELLRDLGVVDLLVGGPPCQGHSNLNNYTRRDDPKNELYERMGRFAEIASPTHVIIENVSAAVHDKTNVVQRTISKLRNLGYHTDYGLVSTETLGVPQTRRRHLVVASKTKPVDIKAIVKQYERKTRSTKWALEDLLHLESESALDIPTALSVITKRRIDYLFNRNLFDLPDHMRPDCHKNGGHSYKSVYGRMRWNRPAQTITTGFTSMGQGRFVHPKRRRTITPHEAARLQFIPDHFRFDVVSSRVALAEMIGNAVPPKLSYVFALELLR